jgi:hypothetical protein
MRQPDICKIVFDESADVTYHVMAYRELSDAEGVRVVKTYLQGTSPRKRPKAGMVVTIRTVIGCEPGL